MSKVLLGHGSGGKLTRRLIDQVFMPHISNRHLLEGNDSAIVTMGNGRVVVTTDAFTVRPLFFPGGDIGKLAVCGSVNDLVVSGARPRYLTAAFVVEEGFPLESLKKVMTSFAAECRNAAVEVVAADTKVVEKGKGDGLFILASALGEPYPEVELAPERIRPGDVVIVTGDIGDHGAAIALARGDLNIQADIRSDCASLGGLLGEVLERQPRAVKLMRDATRGGVATVLKELAVKAHRDIRLFEKDLPIKGPVRALCEMLGFDPLYLANEGKAVLIVGKEDAGALLDRLRAHPLGKDAAVVGEVCPEQAGRLFLETPARGRRVLDALVEDQLPRIC